MPEATTTELSTISEWSPEAVSRFWDYLARRHDLHTDYFTWQVGAGVAKFAEVAGVLSGRVLDYGCGPGFLIGHLLASGVSVTALDFSNESVDNANQRFCGQRGWEGAIVAKSIPTLLDDDRFDLVFCIETLEHLSHDALLSVVTELHRLLRRGGALIATTPFNENLRRSFVYCPFCSTEFHKVQHQRSFTIESMEVLLAEHGFEIRFCKNLNFANFQRKRSWRPLSDVSFNHVKESFRHNWCALLDHAFPISFPHGRAFKLMAQEGPHLCALAIKQ